MIHTRSYTVTFSRPFTLPGLDRDYPPGRYAVEADDEQLDFTFVASRRVATTILLTSGPMTQAWLVNVADLDAALARDALSNSADQR